MNPPHNPSRVSKLPHKNILILAAICISIIGILITYKISKNRPVAQLSGNGILAAANENPESAFADQRILEALNKAKLESLGSATSSNPFAPTPKDSLSDRFSKNIFAAYMRAQQGDVSDADLANEVINDIDTSVMPKPKYSLNELTVTAGVSKAEIQAFGNEFAKVYLETSLPIVQNPAVYNTNIKAISKIYTKMAQELLKIKVPSALAVNQLELINTFYLSSEYFLIIDDQQKDPVKAVLALKLLGEIMLKQKKLFTTMSQYFSKNDILFEKGTPGEIWNNKESIGITAN